MESLDKQLMAVNTAMKNCKNRRMFERYQVIKLYLEGFDVPRISQITGRCLKTIYNYINAYQAGSLEALRMNYSPGRPSLLTSEEKRLVMDVLANKRPEQVGFPAEMNWTCALLREWMFRTFTVRYSLSGINSLLHDLGVTIHSTHVYPCQR